MDRIKPAVSPDKELRCTLTDPPPLGVKLILETWEGCTIIGKADADYARHYVGWDYMPRESAEIKQARQQRWS